MAAAVGLTASMGLAGGRSAFWTGDSGSIFSGEVGRFVVDEVSAATTADRERNSRSSKATSS